MNDPDFCCLCMARGVELHKFTAPNYRQYWCCRSCDKLYLINNGAWSADLEWHGAPESFFRNFELAERGE